MKRFFFAITLPETNSILPLKMDGWNTVLLSFWVEGLFSGAFAVSFREYFFHFFPLTKSGEKTQVVSRIQKLLNSFQATHVPGNSMCSVSADFLTPWPPHPRPVDKSPLLGLQVSSISQLFAWQVQETGFFQTLWQGAAAAIGVVRRREDWLLCFTVCCTPFMFFALNSKMTTWMEANPDQLTSFFWCTTKWIESCLRIFELLWYLALFLDLIVSYTTCIIKNVILL